MITYVVGDLLQSPARVLVNTVNTVGVMGKGIAKDFKAIYPEMFKQYQVFCDNNQFKTGMLWLYKTNRKWVLNFPTKKHWRSPSKVEYIEAGLKKFASTYSVKGITSIAFPMLGCGNGGLDWENEVRPLMEKYLKNLPIDIYIHLYKKDPFKSEHKNIDEIKTWLRNEPESLPFYEVWDDISAQLKKQDSYFTLNDKVGFTAKQIDQPETGIEIKARGTLFKIHQEQLIDIWNHVRSMGFLIPDNATYPSEQFAPYLIAILEKLPYLKPVLISSNYQEMKRNPIGLQYIPDTKDDLFHIKPPLHEVTMHD